MTRHFWVLVHRYAGLYMAFFLTVAGLTGSLLAFKHEINAWLNSQHYRVAVQTGAMLDPFELRERALALVPQARINWIDLYREPGEVYATWPEPRTDPATRQRYKLGFSTLILNPYTGAEIERLKGGYWPLTRENVMDFIYALHYKLALPGSMGVWLFGIAAVIWTLDCFVGFYLTLPAHTCKRDETIHRHTGGSRYRGKISCATLGCGLHRDDGDIHGRRSWWARWQTSWKVKWRGSTFRINFDLHRAGGLWTWAMLLVLAWSSVAFNLGSQVYTPVMKAFFDMKNPYANLPKLPKSRPDPGLDWRAAHAIGQRLMAEQGRRHGFTVRREQSLAYDSQKGIFSYTVHSDRDISEKYGGTTVYFDASRGDFRMISFSFGQNAGTTVTSWLSVLHMAKVWGLPMQIFVCVMGLVVAMLSVTGVYLWLKKRRAERLRRDRAQQQADRSPPSRLPAPGTSGTC